MKTFDYSVDKPVNGGVKKLDLDALVDKTSLGHVRADGMYEVKDWEFDVADDILRPAENKKANATSGSMGALGSLFARLTGSKVLTEADLKPVLDGMKQHLMKKNVAKEIADKVCEGVGESLVGKKVGGFQSKSITILSCCAYPA